MNYYLFLASLVPVPLFYLIYFRHFIQYFRTISYKPKYIEHLEAFLFGIAFALLLALLQPYIDLVLPTSNVLVKSFIKAAALEKLGAVVLISLILRNYRSFNLIESIFSGIVFGVGFSFVENIFYAIEHGASIILVRGIFSVPLHIVTCGFIGYYMGLRKYTTSFLFRLSNTLKAIIYNWLIHGLYDAALMTGGKVSYLVGPLLIGIVIILELFLARSKTIPFLKELYDKGIRYEDWLLLYRQPRFERWITRSSGTSESVIIPFFKWSMDRSQSIVIFIFLMLPFILYPFRLEIFQFFQLALKHEEQVLLAIALPLSVGMMLIMVGSINPEFLRNSIIRIPVMYDAILYNEDKYEETLVTFDISSSGCFLRTYEPIGLDNTFHANFGLKDYISPGINATVVWENHDEKTEPSGSIIGFERPSFRFLLFLLKYHTFRVSHGLFFNLKLPGSESVKRFFIKPFLITQKVKLYKPGAIIFHEGDEGDEFYMIKKGRVQFYKQKESGEMILLSTMGPSEIFGEMAILGNATRNATAIAMEETLVATSGINEIKTLIQYNPEFVYALLKKLSSRANESQNVLLENIEYLEELYKNKILFNYASLIFLTMGASSRRIKQKQISVDINVDSISSRTGMDPELIKLILADSTERDPHSIIRDGLTHPLIREQLLKGLEGLELDLNFQGTNNTNSENDEKE